MKMKKKMDSRNVISQEKLEFGVDFVGFGVSKLFRVIKIFEFVVNIIAIGVPNTLPKRKKEEEEETLEFGKGFQAL